MFNGIKWFNLVFQVTDKIINIRIMMNCSFCAI